MDKLIVIVGLIFLSGCVMNVQKCGHQEDKNDPFVAPKRNVYTFFSGKKTLDCERVTLLTTTDTYYLCKNKGVD